MYNRHHREILGNIYHIHDRETIGNMNKRLFYITFIIPIIDKL